MPNAGLMNLLAQHAAAFPGNADTRTAQFTAISFDFSVEEIHSALVMGKSLVIPEDHVRRDASQLAKWIDQYRVNELFAPTLAIDALVEAAHEAGASLESLTDVLQGGEALIISERLRDFATRNPAMRLHNVYGPAETHAASFYTIPGPASQWPAAAGSGGPIGNVRLYVLDAGLAACSGRCAGRAVYRRRGL